MIGDIGARPSKRKVVLLVLLPLVVLLGGVAWDQLLRVKELTAIEDPAENFKYGGLTRALGIPYYLFAVLPEVFPDLMPAEGGYAAFGFVVEDEGYPVGFAKQTVGFTAVTPNCAMCHVGTYRTSAGAPPMVVPGAPSRANIAAFNRFLWEVIEDERYRYGTLMPVIRERFDPSFLERATYRLLVPLVRYKFREQRELFEWEGDQPTAGWGRMDAFNVIKYNLFDLERDGTIGTSDFQAVWRMSGEEGRLLHWSGISRSREQVEHMSLYGTNLSTKSARLDNFGRVRDFLTTAPVPGFPFPVDGAAAERGERVFTAQCASCHVERGGERTPQSVVGTDDEFLRMWSEPLRHRLLQMDREPFRFPGLEPSDGYVNKRLTGIWMRAPYLHNGSVPTLAHLLEPASARPVTFYRWSDVYDPNALGFEWRSPFEGDELDGLFDTRLRGNSNAGHEFGVELTQGEKRDLLEYLKTL